MLNHLKIFEQPDFLFKLKFTQRLTDQLIHSSTKEVSANTCQSRTDQGKIGPKWDYDLVKDELDQCRSRPSCLDLERVVVNLFFSFILPSVFFLFPFSFPFVCPCRSLPSELTKSNFQNIFFQFQTKCSILFLSRSKFLCSWLSIFCNIFPLFFILSSFTTFIIYNEFFICFFVIDRIYHNIWATPMILKLIIAHPIPSPPNYQSPKTSQSRTDQSDTSHFAL